MPVTTELRYVRRHGYRLVVNIASPREDGLPQDELCGAIRQAIDFGADTCCSARGEPFLRPDCELSAEYLLHTLPATLS
jgi:hypothetical protein